ncbi:MAG: HTTM domain-containing protein [Myxococcales bacterium]|nr:HTTM domain-containing protein [Myxococcales bacterium]
MSSLWRWWVACWDRREPADVMALVRIGVGLVMLAALVSTWRLGLVVPLMGHGSVGELSGAGPEWVWWFRWVGTDERAAWLLFAGLALGEVLLTIGLFTRTSALVTMLLSAQWMAILPDGDRGIDTLLRNVLMLLAFSSAGRRFSVDAALRGEGLAGARVPLPAWPRYLLVLQIVVMYFTAGVQKYAQQWWPWGGWSALYVVLKDWSVSAWPFTWLDQPLPYLLTQVGTVVTIVFQCSYPLVLLHYFPPLGEPGRFRTMFERYRLHWVWIATGMVFHVLLAATMELGIFPWGMMALYWAFLHPDEISGARQ